MSASVAVRQIVRQWLNWEDSAIVEAVAALGARAVRDATAATGRLQRTSVASIDGSSVLVRLEEFAARSSRAPASGKWRWPSFKRATLDHSPNLDRLVQELVHEQDVVARTLIFMDGDLERLKESEAALHSVLEMARDLGKAVDAGARELSVEDPNRAAFFRETIGPALLERERDILTQVAITHQGILALQIVMDGQRALSQSLERARSMTVAALRTAVASRHAIEKNHAMLEQAQALEQTAEAARAATASRRDVARTLDDAKEQAHRAREAENKPADTL